VWSASNLLGSRIDATGVVQDPGGLVISCLQLIWDDDRASGLANMDVYGASVSSDLIANPEQKLSTGAPTQVGVDVTAGAGGYLTAFLSDSAETSRILVHRLDDYSQLIDVGGTKVAASAFGTIGFSDVAWNGSLYQVVWAESCVVKALRLAADATPIGFAGVWSLNPSVTTFDNSWLLTWQNHFSHDINQAEIKSAFIYANDVRARSRRYGTS
jgi:hypothetical protein